MEIPSLPETENNLRHCLLLKADDLYFTLAEPEGEELRNAYLGIPVHGLADENLSEDEIAAIDLERFDVARRIRQLHAMLDHRWLSIDHADRPDTEHGRTQALEFLEHFLSTLPDLAMGGIDLTAARHDAVRSVYNLAFAWLNLVETIESAVRGETETPLSVSDLALLSGLDTRTLRNRCGPGKQIRTSSRRAARERGEAAPAFVSLNALDALDWLAGSKDFTISRIDPGWIASRLHRADTASKTRGLLISTIVNSGPLSKHQIELGFTFEQARDWFDEGMALPRDVTAILTDKLGISN